jgi:vacuolar-type H+-ATPase subunit I/STV1
MLFKLWIYPRNPTILKGIPFLYGLQLKIINIYDTTISDQKIIRGHFEKELKVVSYFRNMQLVYLLLVFLSLILAQPYEIPPGMIVTSFFFFCFAAIIFDMVCVIFICLCLNFPVASTVKSICIGCSVGGVVGVMVYGVCVVIPIISIEVTSPFGHTIQEEMLGV